MRGRALRLLTSVSLSSDSLYDFIAPMGVNPLRTLSEQKRSPELKPILVLPTSGVGARRACKLPINRARFNSFAFKRVEAAALPARGGAAAVQLAAGAGRGRTGGAAIASWAGSCRLQQRARAAGGGPAAGDRGEEERAPPRREPGQEEAECRMPGEEPADCRAPDAGGSG